MPLDINEHEQIVGIGELTVDGVEYPGRAFLLNPTTPVGTQKSATSPDLSVDARGHLPAATSASPRPRRRPHQVA